MGLSAKDWDRTVDFLRATMTEFKVAPQLQNEVVTLFLIVNLSSSSVASVAGMDRQATAPRVRAHVFLCMLASTTEKDLAVIAAAVRRARKPLRGEL